MIVFDIVGARPRVLRPADIKKLGHELARVLRLRETKDIGVRFVTPRTIQALNARYRGIHRPTDVLSFSIPDQTSLGDLVICSSYAREQTKRRKISLREELIRLLAHGTLHLAGFDHATPKTEARMFGLQEQCVSAVSSPSL